MVKALVLAANYRKYKMLIRHFKVNPFEYRYVHDWHDMCGYHWDIPVIIHEGYVFNNYPLGLMENIGARFNNIGMLTEGEIWEDEEVPIQYLNRT